MGATDAAAAKHGLPAASPGRRKRIDVPPPASGLFEGGIDHPDLWLWDAWTYEADGTLVLFTLAIAREDAAGRPTTPATRNDYPFHIRQFRSADGGRSWQDHGAFAEPDHAEGGANVWSGSATVTDGRLLFGFTGVRSAGPGRPFLQSICLSEAPLLGSSVDTAQASVLSDPARDRAAIEAAGYYLAPDEDLGSARGEEDGPILAWRDPFLIPEGGGAFRAYWSAKTGPAEPAVAHARLHRRNEGFVLDALLPPIRLPDGAGFTQAEVPKVYEAPSGGYLMLLSTCDRRREDQPDSEVTKALRLYRSPDLDGPWAPYRHGDSLLPDAEHLFGGSFAAIDRTANEAVLVAPYTEMAAPHLQLTFAPPRRVTLGG